MTGGPIDRRLFLRDLGKGTLSITVFGFLVACSSDQKAVTTVAGTATTELLSTTTGPVTATSAPEAATPETGAASWQRVELGFVSAYIIVRGGEAAIVDTGVIGSAPSIEAGLAAAGLGWDSVGHVILTHLHPDHIGGLGAVLASAADASGYAGEPDIPSISSPRPLLAVGDGDRVFDLEVIATPGHTAGHICVLDAVGGLLVAGDALTGVDGGVAGTTAEASVRKLAGFSFDTVVFGHGDPVEGGASQAVADLAAGL